MQSMMLPKFPLLKDKEAKAALNNFVEKLETREKKLTIKQIKTLRKLAEGLTASIEAEQTGESPKEMGFASKLRASILRRPQKSERTLGCSYKEGG